MDRYPRMPPDEAGARGSQNCDRRPPFFRWDCGNTRNIHRRGDQTVDPFPSPRTTTELHLPGTASHCRNPMHYRSRHVGLLLTQAAGPNLRPGSCWCVDTCSGSSSSATSIRLTSLATPKTVPVLDAKIYPKLDSFSVSAKATRMAGRACAKGCAGSAPGTPLHPHRRGGSHKRRSDLLCALAAYLLRQLRSGPSHRR